LATGGYSNVFYLSTNAIPCNVTATFRAYKKGALFANPCYTQIHPTCIPVTGDHQSKLTLMSESLRNDGRVWVPKKKGDNRKPSDIAEEDRDYYLERKYPSFGNLAPRDIASRSAKEVCDEGRGVGPGGRGVYLDFAAAIKRDGRAKIEEKYDNLFEMYERITGESGYTQPMRIYPAPHYTMGGLWVDYNLMSNIPGLFVLGEANFSDHGANRLGASALMQGLADGYFIAPYTIGNYFGDTKGVGAGSRPALDHAEVKKAESDVIDKLKRLLGTKGKRTPTEMHREVGRLMWDKAGMARNDASLKEMLKKLPEYREAFWKDVHVPGTGEELNMSLERAGRVIDLIEFAELLCLDALTRKESCGGHFREEFQYTDEEVKADPSGKTIKGEAKRDDQNFQFVSGWEFTGTGKEAILHKEPLEFTEVKPSLRSYK
jgi:succinate dehydrogenase / fumarate reductase flavoprotein subunit